MVVASHLAEDPSVQVLALEAGEDLSAVPRADVPAFSQHSWARMPIGSTKPVSRQGLKDCSIGLPLGKALGGTSAINGETDIAPSHAEVDAWALLVNPGWDCVNLIHAELHETATAPWHGLGI